MQTVFYQDSVKTNLSTEKTSKDKFKPLFCGKDFYLSHQNEFKTLYDQTAHLCQKNRLLIYTLTLCCLRRKNDWFSGILNSPRKTFDDSSIQQPENRDKDILIYNFFRSLNIMWPKSLDHQISLYQFLSILQIKAIPESALNGMFQFFCGTYDLLILDYEPAPIEVLNLQIKNQRVLTFQINHQLWPEKKYGERDFLSFLLHDFIHAEHFFSDPQKRLGQIGFYKFIQKILSYKILDEYFLSPCFNDQFSYLISDMNSHLIHLLKTFRAIVDHQNIDPKTWELICQTTSSTSNTESPTTALLNINTPSFSNSDARCVMHFFETLLN